MSDLANKRCLPCEAGIKPLTAEDVKALLKNLPQWQSDPKSTEIFRDFRFKNYYHTMAFVNAIAWIAHQQNHHADLTVGYNHCKVRYSTHAIEGLSENDFICAAKVDEIFADSQSEKLK